MRGGGGPARAAGRPKSGIIPGPADLVLRPDFRGRAFASCKIDQWLLLPAEDGHDAGRSFIKGFPIINPFIKGNPYIKGNPLINPFIEGNPVIKGNLFIKGNPFTKGNLL